MKHDHSAKRRQTHSTTTSARLFFLWNKFKSIFRFISQLKNHVLHKFHMLYVSMTCMAPLFLTMQLQTHTHTHTNTRTTTQFHLRGMDNNACIDTNLTPYARQRINTRIWSNNMILVLCVLMHIGRCIVLNYFFARRKKSLFCLFCGNFGRKAIVYRTKKEEELSVKTVQWAINRHRPDNEMLCFFRNPNDDTSKHDMFMLRFGWFFHFYLSSKKSISVRGESRRGVEMKY